MENGRLRTRAVTRPGAYPPNRTTAATSVPDGVEQHGGLDQQQQPERGPAVGTTVRPPGDRERDAGHHRQRAPHLPGRERRGHGLPSGWQSRQDERKVARKEQRFLRVVHREEDGERARALGGEACPTKCTQPPPTQKWRAVRRGRIRLCASGGPSSRAERGTCSPGSGRRSGVGNRGQGPSLRSG